MTMILRSSPPSPFGRKTKIAAKYLGLMDQITVEATATGDPDDSIRTQNPLGKIPALVLESGQVIYDSWVIVDYLDHLAGRGKLIPNNSDEKYKALVLAALADGMMDAGILIVYEARLRPEEKRHADWVDYQREKIIRALASLEANPPAAGLVTIGTIGLACALGYLIFRELVDWQPDHPNLAAWLEAFDKTVPAYGETTPE